MLSSTRDIYRQTFADPGNILLRKSLRLEFHSLEKEFDGHKDMLLIQPRERSRAIPDHDHAISHPASWQADVQKAPQDAQSSISAGAPPDVLTTHSSPSTFSKTEIAALSLEQLQELTILVSDRIQIKQRFNNTPLRRIISRQASSGAFQTTFGPDSDTASQTDTLVYTETPDTVREPPEVRRARYNSTPLRRILSRQTSTSHGTENLSAPAHTHSPAEAPSVVKARYNNTPLRRILSRQTPSAPPPSALAARQSIPVSESPVPHAPMPRSSTPLRRILLRQVSAQAIEKEDDEISERADSVIDPESPVRALSTASAVAPAVDVALISSNKDRIQAYETNVWGFNSSLPSTATLTLPSPGLVEKARVRLNDEVRVRAYEESVWAKTPFPPRVAVEKEKEKEKSTTITVTEVLVEAKRPKRIVVDSKGSPLRRILQRQTTITTSAIAIRASGSQPFVPELPDGFFAGYNNPDGTSTLRFLDTHENITFTPISAGDSSGLVEKRQNGLIEYGCWSGTLDRSGVDTAMNLMRDRLSQIPIGVGQYSDWPPYFGYNANGVYVYACENSGESGAYYSFMRDQLDWMSYRMDQRCGAPAKIVGGEPWDNIQYSLESHLSGRGHWDRTLSMWFEDGEGSESDEEDDTEGGS
ncbi:hypothetical protein E8E12_011785 [Didymella heteroderae]|uniref:Uncharacterized protein n=1 Tax=Didymella heteroderae TaxID=1769908 RepID=A0A9P4X2M5_9PLEO|nr:hypothetical protein E8E12_011785 [Didymella heteroderae]